MLKKTKDAAQPELVTDSVLESTESGGVGTSLGVSDQSLSENAGGSVDVRCPVHGEHKPIRTPKSSVFRFPLLLTAALFAVVLAATNCWMEAGFKSDIKHSCDWEQYVAKLSPADAKLMETRFILDDIKTKYFQIQPVRIRPPWMDSSQDWVVQRMTDVPTKVRLGKFYVYRNNRPAALTTLERAFRVFESDQKGASYYDWKDWATLCRLYIEQNRYEDAARVIDTLLKWNPSLDSAKLQYSSLHELAVQAYEVSGQKEKANHFRKLIEKANKSPERSRDWELDKTTVQAYGDVRQRAYDYALSLLFEGKSSEAASKLEDLSRDMKAANAGGESSQFRASLNMMLPVAYVSAENWEAAARNFPRALRLADQQKYNPSWLDAKPALYRAYARFLTHSGRSEEAANYANMAREIRDASMSAAVDYSKKNPHNHFDPADLFGPGYKPSK